MSIPGIKGVEVGAGFAAAQKQLVPRCMMSCFMNQDAGITAQPIGLVGLREASQMAR